MEKYKAPKKNENSPKNLGWVNPKIPADENEEREQSEDGYKAFRGFKAMSECTFFMNDACDEPGMSTATTWPYHDKDHATHVFTEVAASPRLFILGGVENGRGGNSSLTPKVDGGAHPRVATGYMSGISSGTGGLGWSGLASCICADGKYEARGVEVREEVASIGVRISSITGSMSTGEDA